MNRRKHLRIFMWLLTCFGLLFVTATSGCNCGTPPVNNDGSIVTDGGTIKPDNVVTETSDETQPDAAPDTTPDEPDPDKQPPCYSLGDPCGGTGCNPSCSGQSLTCQGGLCQPEEKPDQPPPDQMCPARCGNHDDCRNTPACGDRRNCINRVCTVPAKICPRRCHENKDCQTPLCGARIRCNAGVCDTLPRCPRGCTEDSDCNVAACGPRKQCLNGVCTAPRKNSAPTAIAERSQTVEVGTRVQLNGSKSSDPDGDKITYRWNIVKRPTGSLTAFDDPSSATPAFVPDRAGKYLIVLVVNDGTVDSPAASVTIEATKKTLPTPRLVTFSPRQYTEGAVNRTVRVFGLNFQSGAKLLFNNLALTTKFVNNTELVITLPSGLRAGSYPVVIQNPDGRKSNIVNYTVITKPSVPPILRSLNPVEVDAGKAFTLTLLGDKFVKGAEVTVNSTLYNTSFVSSQRLSANIRALAAGIYNVQVRNPDGKRSTTLTLRVVTVKKGPILTSILPNIAFAKQTFLFILNGDRFVKGSTIIIGTQTYQSVYVSAKQIRITNLSIATAGNYSVEVENPGGLKSNRLILEVKKTLSKPIITLLVPSSVRERTAVTIAVKGNDFVGNAIVTVKGVKYPTSFVSVGELRLTLPKTLGIGTYPVQVTNPDGQKSNIANLTVIAAPPLPVITSIKPAKVPVGITSTVTITGKNFIKGAQVQVGVRLVPTTYISATQLTAQIPKTLKAGTYALRVFNPGNQVSNSVKLQVFKSAPPQITSLVPNKGTSGSVITVRILGKNFFSGTQVIFQGGKQPTNYVSGTEVTMTLSLTSLNPATYQIWVQNPDGQNSNKIPFVVEAPQGPQITSLLPKEGQTNTTVNMIISGARFATGAVVNFNGKTHKVTYLNASTLGLALSLRRVAAGTYPFSVTNPNKKTSNIVYFTVTAKKLPKPIITQIKPSSIKIGSAGANNPIYILGKYFQNGALLSFRLPFVGSIGLPTNFINSQTLVMTAQFPRISIPFPPQRTNAFVTNPDKQNSNSVQVTVSP